MRKRKVKNIYVSLILLLLNYIDNLINYDFSNIPTNKLF